MTISIFCDCGVGHEAPEEKAGLIWTCPGCDREWVVPEPGPAEAIFYIGPKTRRRCGKRTSLVNYLIFLSFVLFFLYMSLPRVSHCTGGRDAQCLNNLKNIALGLCCFANSRGEGHFPAAAITDKNGKPLLSWRVAILPQLES